VGTQELDAVVNHCGDGARHTPHANEGAHSQQNEDSAHSDGDAIHCGLADFLECVAIFTSHQPRHHRSQDQGNLEGAAHSAVAIKHYCRHQQDDQRQNGDQRVEHGRRLNDSLFFLLLTHKRTSAEKKDATHFPNGLEPVGKCAARLF